MKPTGRRLAARLHRTTALAAWLAALGVTAGHAGSIYVCRDPDGRAHTADRPIAECARTTLRELRNDGSVRREIAAPFTPEQVRQREADEQKRLAEEAARRERQHRDRALLMAYPTEARLAQQRDRLLDGLRRERDEAQARIDGQQRRLQAVQTQLDAAARRRQPPSPELAQQAEEITEAVRTDEAVVQAKGDEIARLGARFDADRQRLRQLLDSETAAALQTAGSR